MIKRLFIAASICLSLVIPAQIGIPQHADAAASAMLTLWPPSHAS